MSSSVQIGWVGLGSMGLAMATNLQQFFRDKHLPPLIFTNRTMSRGESLLEIGAIGESCFARLVERCDIIFSSVSDDAVVKTHMQDALILPSLRGKIFCETSTIHPDTVGWLVEQMAHSGASLITAPVFGSTSVAVSGGLIFVLSGPEEAMNSVIPYCAGVMGKANIKLGSDPKRAPTLKITGNSILLSITEVISGAHALAEKAGIANNHLEILLDLLFNGGPLVNYSRRITSGGYAPPEQERPSFAIDLAIKDAHFALNLADSVGAELPVLQIACNHLEAAKDRHGPHLDSTAIFGVLRENAGGDFATDVVKSSGRNL